MQQQLDLFKGKELRDIGINQSLETAEKNCENWGQRAYSFLLKYIQTNNTFMAEDVRVASEGYVPQPPSKRSWGSVFVKAKKNKIITSLGYDNVKNPKAHGTPATLWSVNYGGI
jgi:hypothetical protein